MTGCPHKPHKNTVRAEPEVKANGEGRSRMSGWLFALQRAVISLVSISCLPEFLE
jgi:hypothetical protein